MVTGRSSGIGFDIARAFLEQGDNVVLNGCDPAELDGASARLGSPERVTALAGNVGERTTGESLVGAAVERFDGVDVLVNNAGTFGPKPFLEVAEAELDYY